MSASLVHTWTAPLLRAAAQEGYAASTAPGATVMGPYGWILDDGTEVLLVSTKRQSRLLVAESGGRVLELNPCPDDIPTSDLVRDLRSGTRAATTIKG